MNSKISRGSEFIPISQASQKLGISKALTYQLLKQGKLQAYSFGRRCLRINIKDLDRYIRSAACTAQE